MTRIIIVDDHELVLSSWKELLEKNPAFNVIATCTSAMEAMKKVEELMPDLLLVDIKMAPINGFELAIMVGKKFPTLRIIGLSVNDLPAYALKLLASGGHGYLTKTSTLEEINFAITEVMQGRNYICKEVSSKMR